MTAITDDHYNKISLIDNLNANPPPYVMHFIDTDKHILFRLLLLLFLSIDKTAPQFVRTNQHSNIIRYRVKQEKYIIFLAPQLQRQENIPRQISLPLARSAQSEADTNLVDPESKEIPSSRLVHASIFFLEVHTYITHSTHPDAFISNSELPRPLICFIDSRFLKLTIRMP